MARHVHRRVVRFGDCDPAGIVYFPRFFDWFHEAMERWFADSLGVDYADLVVRQGLGFPAVRTEATFLAPCPLGEPVDVALRVDEVGRKSLRLAYDVLGVDGKLRARGATSIVVCRLDASTGTLQATAFPPELLARIEAFRAAA